MMQENASLKVTSYSLKRRKTEHILDAKPADESTYEWKFCIVKMIVSEDQRKLLLDDDIVHVVAERSCRLWSQDPGRPRSAERDSGKYRKSVSELKV